MRVRYRHVEIEAEKAEDIAELVKSGLVPVHVEAALLRCVERCADEKLRAESEQSAAATLGDATASAKGMREIAVAMKTENARWSKGPEKAAARKKNDRPEAYSAAVRRSVECRRAIAALEDSLAVSLRVLREGKQRAVAQTRERHAAEMEREAASSQSPAECNLAVVVARQVGDLEDIDKEWAAKESALRETQTAEYWDYVRDLSDETSQAVVLPATVQQQQQQCSSPTRPRKGSGPRSQPASPAIGDRAKAISRVVITAVNQSLSPLRQAIIGTPSRSSDSSADTPPFATMQLYVGQNQIKMLYRIDAVIAPLIPFMCEASCGHLFDEKREKAMVQLYSQSLCGIVVPTLANSDAAPSSSAEWEERLSQQCGRSNDFHFGTVASQVAPLRSMPPMKPGEIYTTRHSNLIGAHVAFHLVVDPNDMAVIAESGSKASSTTLQGLWSVLALASEFDVTEISIPVPLVANPPMSPLSLEATLTHVDVIVRNMKSFFASRMTESIKKINLVFPEGTPPVTLNHVKLLV